ncbi:hypothetical protein T06_7627 [Trichinella sp. T6]|nr:hypothetical protein T06_7627 [Trichinella sp. T6]
MDEGKARHITLTKTTDHHEETKRKIKMLVVTSFLPVPQADTDVSLLEAGTAGSTLALFQYFRQE